MMNHSFFGSLLLLTVALSANAQQVTYAAATTTKTTEARFGRPAQMPASGSAGGVVILHHGGGCVNSQTPKYADALNKAGYFTLEPCLFPSASERGRAYLPQVFGALKYLAQVPGVDKNRIAITGGSFGGILSFVSATSWAYETYADRAFPRFAAHAPFYPVCYAFERQIKGKVGRAESTRNL